MGDIHFHLHQKEGKTKIGTDQKPHDNSHYIHKLPLFDKPFQFRFSPAPHISMDIAEVK